MEAQLQQLIERLDQIDLQPQVIEQLLAGVGEGTRNALVHVIAARPGALPLTLLGALQYLLTPQNAGSVAAVYRANLSSPEPLARHASLYGLEELGDASILQAAESLLGDSDDDVVAAACDVLLRHAPGAAAVRGVLEEVHRAHEGDPAFYLTLTVLQAHGIGSGPPPEEEEPDDGGPPVA